MNHGDIEERAEMIQAQQAPGSAPRMPGGSAEILEDRALRRVRSGVAMSIRLASYRSLPLSCLRSIRVTIDGRLCESDELTLVLDGNHHQLAELAERTDLWWYILDSAELRVALDTPLAPGEHSVELSMVTIMPFATGGRSTRTDHCSRRLALSDHDA